MTRPSESTTSRGPRRRPPRFLTLVLVLATVLSVLGAFAAYAVAKRHNPTYRSVGAISFDQPLKFAESTNSGIIDKLSRIRLTYIGLAKTDAVVDPVSQEVGLPKGQVRASIFTSADKSSLLLFVGAESGNRNQARRIAAALLNQVVTATADQQDKAKIPDKDRVVASVVIQPSGAGQISPSPRLPITAAIVTGLLVLLGILGIGSLIRRRPN